MLTILNCIACMNNKKKTIIIYIINIFDHFPIPFYPPKNSILIFSLVYSQKNRWEHQCSKHAWDQLCLRPGCTF